MKTIRVIKTSYPNPAQNPPRIWGLFTEERTGRCEHVNDFATLEEVVHKVADIANVPTDQEPRLKALFFSEPLRSFTVTVEEIHAFIHVLAVTESPTI